MQVITVHLDRVFDVRHGYRLRKRVVFFSFQSGDTIRRDVAAPGGEAPQPGSTIAVCLERDDDWTYLPGWKDVRSGRIVTPGILLEVVIVVMVWAMTLYAYGHPPPPPKVSGWPLFAVLSVVIPVLALRSVRATQRVRLALERVGTMAE